MPGLILRPCRMLPGGFDRGGGPADPTVTQPASRSGSSPAVHWFPSIDVTRPTGGAKNKGLPY